MEQKKRVLNLTHNDQDGIACHIVLKCFYNHVSLIKLHYSSLESYIKNIHELKEDMLKNIDIIYITDLNLNIEQYNTIKEIGLPIVYLDHHESGKEIMNKPLENRIVLTNKCAAFLTKSYLEHKFKIDLSYLNNYLKLVNDYDLWIHKEILTKPLSYIFDYYYKKRDIFSYIKKFMKKFNGVSDINKEEREFIEKTIENHNKAFDNLEIFDLKNSRSCIISTKYELVNEMCDRVFKTYSDINLIFCINPKKISIRTNIDIDVGSVLKRVNKNWGGHKQAAGVNFNENISIEKMIYIINNLEDILISEYPVLIF